MVGGTGTFGERLVRGLLATTDMRVVVAARGVERARALADALGGLPRVAAVRLDVASVGAEALRTLGAFAVVDAAGPYRPGAHRLARAAIQAGMHYLDLADGRAYVAGFAAGLDGPARAAGVVALAGCSSTPALSCAALDHLTAGWTRVDRVEVAILPGNRAPRGLAVMRSILSWAGQPVRVFLDGGWTTRPGWGLTRRTEVPGLGRRWSSLADTPDLDQVPARYHVCCSAVFRAGLELPLLHWGLLLASLPIRAAGGLGLRLSLEPLAPAMRFLAGLVHGLGTDRGGMVAEASGLDAAGQPLRRRWTLVAEAGDGPVIPTLPALAILRALAAGKLLPPGARPCVGVLTLAEIAAEFAPYRIHTSEDAAPSPPPLFARALGRDYDALPAPVRAVHAPRPCLMLRGRASVEGPTGLLARLAAVPFGFPPAAADVPVWVCIEAIEGGEAWTRSFAGRRFCSRMAAAAGVSAGGGLEERFGPFAFRLRVAADAGGLMMQVGGWRIGPIPMPRRLAPRASAREWVDEHGRFRFDVTIALPMVGRLVRYAGWLEPEGSATEGSSSLVPEQLIEVCRGAGT